ncbi:MAG: hypothetical protein JJE17_08070 [Peptostreptococcaceae bacterium]|nr:hypothetical protein [Peptostreptococcaceae bacterium]
MDDMVKKFKKIMEEVTKILRNPSMINDLLDEINEQSKEIEVLRDGKNSLTETVQDLREHAYYLDELKEELLKQKNQISGSIDQMLDLAINANSMLDNPKIYNRLEFIDPEGWCIYRASQEILNIDVYREFIVEDTMGRFEESDGHELKEYLEIAAFGECTYKIISGIHEALDTYAIDYNSKEYKDYLDKLYPLAIHKLIDKLHNEEPSVKLQFLLQQMEYSNQETKVENAEKVLKSDYKINEDFMENETTEVDDEEMEI